jgi:hypothetical protein
MGRESKRAGKRPARFVSLVGRPAQVVCGVVGCAAAAAAAACVRAS